MRPTSQRQSAFRSPLNRILGTEANVRLLRVLSKTSVPMSATELARRSSITLSGVSRALEALEETGIVEFIGAGSRRPVELRRNHPLAPALETLFAAEANRANGLYSRIRSATETLTPPPLSVWMEGPVASGTDRPGDALVIGVLTSARELDAVASILVSLLTPLEMEADITIEVRGHTRADLAVVSGSRRRELSEVIPILGPPPLALVADQGVANSASRRRAPSSVSHAVRDEQARALAAAVAAKLAEDPSLVARARDRIAHRLPHASPGEQQELQEWERILRTMPLPRLRRFLTDPGERATRLRQSLPFTGILTRGEREELLARASASPLSSSRRRRSKE